MNIAVMLSMRPELEEIAFELRPIEMVTDSFEFDLMFVWKRSRTKMTVISLTIVCLCRRFAVSKSTGEEVAAENSIDLSWSMLKAHDLCFIRRAPNTQQKHAHGIHCWDTTIPTHFKLCKHRQYRHRQSTF